MVHIKTKTTKLVGVRMTSELYKLVGKNARNEQRTVSNYIRKILSKHLDETDYLLSTTKNRKRLILSKKEAEKKNLIHEDLADLTDLKG